MIERNEFLKMCQEVAVLPDGARGFKENVPLRLKINFHGDLYYPFGYIMTFDKKEGKPIHTAILIAERAFSQTIALLSDIERADLTN